MAITLSYNKRNKKQKSKKTVQKKVIRLSKSPIKSSESSKLDDKVVTNVDIDYRGARYDEIYPNKQKDKDVVKTGEVLEIHVSSPITPYDKGNNQGGKKPQEIEIYVENQPVFKNGKIDVVITNPTDRLKVNTSRDLKYKILTTYLKRSDVDVEWTSSNTNIATIDNNGTLTGVNIGSSCEITLKLTYKKNRQITGEVSFFVTVVKRGFTYTFGFQLS